MALNTFPKVPCPTRLRYSRSPSPIFMGVQSKVSVFVFSALKNRSALLDSTNFFFADTFVLCSLFYDYSFKRFIIFLSPFYCPVFF